MLRHVDCFFGNSSIDLDSGWEILSGIIMGLFSDLNELMDFLITHFILAKRENVVKNLREEEDSETLRRFLRECVEL